MSNRLTINSINVMLPFREKLLRLFDVQDESLKKVELTKEKLSNIHNQSKLQIDYMENIKSESSDFQKYLVEQQKKHREEEAETKVQYDALFSKCLNECEQTDINEKRLSDTLNVNKNQREEIEKNFNNINFERDRYFNNITDNYNKAFELYAESANKTKSIIEKYKSELNK